MKKICLLFIIILLISFVSATNVGYVLKTPSQPEGNVINALNDLGYSYDLIDDDNILLTNFSNYDLIIVWNEPLVHNENIPITERKSLVATTYYLDDWGIADYAGSQISSGYAGGRILIVNSITEGFSSPIQLHNDTNVVLHNLPYANRRASDLDNVLSTDNYHQYPVIGTIDVGGELYGGGTADARTAFFGITQTEYWTSDSKELFKNSLEWLVIGEDGDSDGFYYDEDCNDSDPDINPNATEIAYNSIDEDCDGFDLVDLDEDTYDCDGSIDLNCPGVIGNDCNDSDPDISPGSSDVYMNCANDAPIVQNISKINVYEGEMAEIVVDAIDPENDSLTYDINDTRFTNNGNGNFTWLTNSSDYGDYIFTINVSDGSLLTEIEVEIEVDNTNQVPICSVIPPLVWDEDTNVSLNLSDYCYDPDNESIAFAFNNTSNSTHINLGSLEDGIANFSVEPDWFGLDWIIFKVGDGKNETLTSNITLNVTPVNDAPIFQGQINNISWYEDTNLTDTLNLSDYFLDVDGDLVYNVTGNIRITIVINGSLVSFYPDEDWSGVENVVFSGADGIDFIYSNAVSLEVLNLEEAPEFGSMNCNTSILEDVEENCELNVSDFEGDELTFNVINESNLDCNINNITLTYVSYQDYYGNASCLVRVTDNDGYDEFLLEVNISPVNDAPVLDNIANIISNEGDLVEILAIANDVENDSLTYDINDTRFTNNGNGNFTWLTDYLDAGTYYVKVNVTDGNLTDEQNITITILDANEPPHLDSIPDLEVEEDSGFFEGIIVNASDNDGTIEGYEITDEDLNKVDCELTDNLLGITPAEDWFGIGENATTCTVEVIDDDGATDSYTFKINVTNVNDAPVIDSYSPTSSNPKISEDGSQYFDVNWHDIDNSEGDIIIRWYEDSLFQDTGDNYTFNGENVSKEYNITVVVDDGDLSDSFEWALTTSTIPIADNYDGDTTDFSGMNDNDLMSLYLILEKTGFGKIEFLEPVDMRDIVDLDSFSDIQLGLAGIDTSIFSALANKRARITFYNIDENKTPAVYYDQEFTLDPSEVTTLCSAPLCSNINYDQASQILSFEVDSFSTFVTGDTLTCSQQNGYVCGSGETCRGSLIDARDTNTCCSIKCSPNFNDIDECETINEDIVVEIKDPDDGDDFKIGETIDGKVEVKNNFDEDKDFDVEIYLYDATEDEEMEDVNENIDIDEDDKEKINYEIEIPDDVDSDNVFYIYVKAEDEDNDSLCNEDFIEIEIERENHDVIIENMRIDDEKAICGDRINIEVEVKNIGLKEEDVYIKIENKELNIEKDGEKFILEEYDRNGNDYTESLNIKIPEDAESGNYTLIAKAIFGSRKDEAKDFLILEGCKEREIESDSLGKIELTTKTKGKSIKIDEKTKLIMLNGALLIGIIFFIILISLVKKR